MKVKVMIIKYRGEKQGYKVFLDGRKYPRARGEWYTTLIRRLAVANAIVERQEENEQG